MVERYELKTAGTVLPISVEEARLYLKSDEGEDANLALLIRAAVQHAETYTGRDFRANTWTLTLDGFPTNDRIVLRRCTVASVTAVRRFVWDENTATNVNTVVSSADYYLKQTQDWSEVLLKSNLPTNSPATGKWPTDVTKQQPEANVSVEFVTEPFAFIEEAKVGVLQHIAALWANRGDCLAALSAAGGGRVALHADLAAQSGADALLDHFRVSRI